MGAARAHVDASWGQNRLALEIKFFGASSLKNTIQQGVTASCFPSLFWAPERIFRAARVKPLFERNAHCLRPVRLITMVSLDQERCENNALSVQRDAVGDSLKRRWFVASASAGVLGNYADSGNVAVYSFNLALA